MKLKKIKKLFREYKEKLSYWWLMEGRPWLDFCRPYRFLRTRYYNIKYGIRNLFRWLPVIWRDRTWDAHYLYSLLEFKFKNMEKDFRRCSWHVGAEKQADQIKVCRLLCKRLKEEEYTTPYDDRNKPHNEWFRRKVEESFHAEPDEKGHIILVKQHEPDEPEGRWIFSQAEHENYMKQQDLDLLGKIIRKHSLGWWY